MLNIEGALLFTIYIHDTSVKFDWIRHERFRTLKMF